MEHTTIPLGLWVLLGLVVGIICFLIGALFYAIFRGCETCYRHKMGLPSDDDLDSAALRTLNRTLTMPDTRNAGRYSKRDLELEQENITKIREWIKTVEDAKLRKAYRKWLNYAQGKLNEVLREQKKAKSDQGLTDEQIERKKRESSEEDRQSRINRLLAIIPTPDV